MLGYAFDPIPTEFEPGQELHIRRIFWHRAVRMMCRRIGGGCARPLFRWEPVATAFPPAWRV